MAAIRRDKERFFAIHPNACMFLAKAISRTSCPFSFLLISGAPITSGFRFQVWLQFHFTYLSYSSISWCVHTPLFTPFIGTRNIGQTLRSPWVRWSLGPNGVLPIIREICPLSCSYFLPSVLSHYLHKLLERLKFPIFPNAAISHPNKYHLFL